MCFYVFFNLFVMECFLWCIFRIVLWLVKMNFLFVVLIFVCIFGWFMLDVFKEDELSIWVICFFLVLFVVIVFDFFLLCVFINYFVLESFLL